MEYEEYVNRKTNKNLTPFAFDGRLVVHVGTHKTGTTSIQSYCMDNYDSLLKIGCLYPRSGRYSENGNLVLNHHPLVRSIIGESTLELSSQLDDLANEIKLANPQVIVISSEILSREYLSAEPFEAITELFPLAKREWVIFLRAQAEVLTSRYAEMIKTRKISWPHGMELINSAVYLDHRLRLEKLRYAVKDDPIRVLSFNTEKYRLLEAFFQICKFTISDGVDSYHRNTSLPWGALHILRLTNRLPKFLQRYIRGLVTLIGQKLVKTRADFLVSWGNPLSQREREQVQQYYRESNGWVEEEYFGGQQMIDPETSKNLE